MLAVWLTHAYAHTSKHLNFLPEALKGADMSLWNTAQALGLKCLAVPIMTISSWRGNGLRVAEPTFRTFNGPSSGDFSLDVNGPDWGQKMPESKITWLNDASEDAGGEDKSKGKGEGTKKDKSSLEEVQLAYLSVSHHLDHPCFCPLSPNSFTVHQRALHRHRILSRCHAHPHSALP